MTRIYDQQSDRSQVQLIKIAKQVTNPDLQKWIACADTSNKDLTKVASDQFADPVARQFPISSMDDVILSKVYFDAAKDSMLPKVASQVAKKLNTYLDLHDVPEELFTYTIVKEASATKEIPLLVTEEGAFCKVASAPDLVAAGEEFTQSYLQLSMHDRVTFSQNFVKCAGHLEVTEYPDIIAKYAAIVDTDLTSTRYWLQMRHSAATRAGKSGVEFTKLAEMIDTLTIAPSPEELTKLAEIIQTLDEQYDFTHPRYDKKLPDAMLSVFNKVAKDKKETEEAQATSMTEADIVAQLGEDSLEAVKTPDTKDNIDRDRLARFLALKGDTANEDSSIQ